ncbi:MAG: glycosyltransferase family 1 protein [Bacteroidaceae bacterium]|nr:glycosyltransferase family 1 protein [Candidatus Colenecus caballi]MCQ2073345.1 glycosyltransferase family 1 protein [Bacteroidaceae bacterium]
MKILLLGEYSNVHNTLAKGLRRLGHQVTVASDGDSWKDYPRDIDLKRDLCSRTGRISFLWRLMKALPSMRGYDIVQIINPIFFELKAERIMPFYRYLRRHNGKIVLGAFGMDYYWVNINTDIRPLRYSDFNIGERIRTDIEAQRFRDEWEGTPKEKLNREIASDCDGIVAGLYEYWATYNEVPELRDKMHFIPFPIEMPGNSPVTYDGGPLKIFAGISRGRSAYKGTDIMLAAAHEVQKRHPGLVELQIAEGVPFEQYSRMMEGSDAILDQLYSYTPSMNSLLAMSKGIIDIGGGEPENYDILGENELRPIVNVQPDFESVVREIEQLVLHPENINALKEQSVEYVHRHHDYMKVAQQYIDFYRKL